MTPQEKLDDFIKKHTFDKETDGTKDIYISEEDQPKYFELVAATLPEDQQKEYILENEYTRLWNMLDTAKFENDYQKNQLCQNLFTWKATEYMNDILMSYIQSKLNLTDDETNKLYNHLFNKALQTTKTNDDKHLKKLENGLQQLKDLDTDIKIRHFGNIYGFNISTAKLDLNDKSNNSET